MDEKLLRKYAQLAVVKGVNVQKGQDVIINASVNDAHFVKYVIEEAYLAGARHVRVEWSFQEQTLLNYKYETIETLTDLPKWVLEKQQHNVDTLPAQIHILSDDPDGLKEIDQDKMMAVRKVVGPVLKKYRDMMDNKFQWNIIGIPSVAWAKKVFPDLDEEKAVEALWDVILKVSRVDENAIDNWNKHNKNLQEKCDKLNKMQVKSMHFKNDLGTDFSVSFKEATRWLGGSEKTINKVEYNPNIPTEECFTSPDKLSANGVVFSSKPLSVMGNLVTDFGFKFVDGKVCEVIAKSDEEKALLEKLISLDEGAKMLGEVALVPYSSPICQSGVLFLNTLYDENACCHLAIGRGFEETIADFANKTKEEIASVDLNQSMIHVDFMIGTADLRIVATTVDGKEVVIFDKGDWAI